MSADAIAEEGRILRSFAEHHVQRDWDYTRNTGSLQSIRYDRPEERVWARIRKAIHWLLRRQPAWARGWGPNRFYMAYFALRRDRHLPDGQLNGGCVLTYWEEDGEYIQLVQPSVGSLIADFLESDPDHPHAKRIAAEVSRIRGRYGDRIESGEVTSCD